MITNTQNKNNIKIRITDLQLDFNDKTIFEDLNFQLNAKDKVTIVGENGVGKSTFLKLINGEYPCYEDKVEVKGDIGYLPQSFEKFKNIKGIEHLINHSNILALKQLLEDSPNNHSKSWYQEFNNNGGFTIWKVLSLLGLNYDSLEKRFFDLSSGERAKLHLCALEHRNPNILLLDEPTNHLDYNGLKWLERFLKSFSGGVIMVTHDRTLINNVSNRISELSPITHKFFHFRGSYKNYLSEQEKIYERAKLERIRQEKELGILQEKLVNFHQDLLSNVVQRPSKDRDKLGFNAKGERNQKSQSRLAKQIDHKIGKLQDTLMELPQTRQKIDFNLSSYAKYEDISISLQNIKKCLNESILFESLSFCLEKQDRLIITGRNGIGKTTLLEMIYGTLKPDIGTIELSDSIKIGFMDQEQQLLDLNKSAFETIYKDQLSLFSEESTIKFLEKFGIYYTPDLYNPLKNVSIGCRRKIQLAQIITQGANLILLDEPTNHIDLLSLEKIEEQLISFPGIVIAVSHDRYFISKVATKIINLEENIATQNNNKIKGQIKC